MIKIILCVVLSSILSAVGQICFKLASNQIDRPGHKNVASVLKYIRKIMRIQWVWFGLASMGTALIVWLAAISQSDLSLVYPLGSLYYIFVLCSARFVLKEKLDAAKIFGTFFILLGIIVIIRS